MFFNKKNPTPRQLANLTAFNIAGTLLFVLLFLRIFFPYTINTHLVWILPVIVFFVSELFVALALRRFIYRKIKLIYKTIHKLKAPPGSITAKVDLKHHIIDEVEREVREWAAERASEIDDLKKMESYRRDFLGNVSHELKTPIFNIQGYIYTLLDGGLEDEKINMLYLEKAASNIERLNSIVEDLTIISKLEEGALNMHPIKFSIYELTKEVMEDLNFMAEEKSIKLSFKEGIKRTYTVKADREAIRQVITNLITNSIKYGKKNGRTSIGFYDLESNILIEISDDGIGIAKEHIPRLFERFYRVDHSRSRDQGGTGLGLAIVKHIVEAHHQTINVRSAEGNGSTFGFTLERADS